MVSTWLSTAQVAELFHVNRVTVYRWVRKGEVKAFEVGNNLKIPLREVIRLCDRFGFSGEEAVKRYGLEELHAERRGGTGRQENVILVVDEDAEILDFFRKLFEETDLGGRGTLIACSDGFDAALRIGRVRPALVIIGKFMSKTAGHELACRISSIYDDVLIVFMTSPRDEWTGQQSSCFAGPLELKDVYGFVSKALEHGVSGVTVLPTG